MKTITTVWILCLLLGVPNMRADEAGWSGSAEALLDNRWQLVGKLEPDTNLDQIYWTKLHELGEKIDRPELIKLQSIRETTLPEEAALIAKSNWQTPDKVAELREWYACFPDEIPQWRILVMREQMAEERAPASALALLPPDAAPASRPHARMMPKPQQLLDPHVKESYRLAWEALLLAPYVRRNWNHPVEALAKIGNPNSISIIETRCLLIVAYYKQRKSADPRTSDLWLEEELQNNLQAMWAIGTVRALRAMASVVIAAEEAGARTPSDSTLSKGEKSLTVRSRAIKLLTCRRTFFDEPDAPDPWGAEWKEYKPLVKEELLRKDLTHKQREFYEKTRDEMPIRE